MADEGKRQKNRHMTTVRNDELILVLSTNSVVATRKDLANVRILGLLLEYMIDYVTSLKVYGCHVYLFYARYRIHRRSKHLCCPISARLYVRYTYIVSGGKRRLSTILVRMKFAENLKEAVTYIEQGHVKVGLETVADPAFLVTSNILIHQRSEGSCSSTMTGWMILIS
ncbi:hypothetical protein QQ045_025075 [Rhodiola kirilowii]